MYAEVEIELLFIWEFRLWLSNCINGMDGIDLETSVEEVVD